MGRWARCCQSREAEGQLALWLAVLRDCVNAHWWMRGGDVGRGTERGVEWVDKGTMVAAVSTGFCHWAMVGTGTRRERHFHLCGYHAPRHLRATAPASSSISSRLSRKVRTAVTQTFHLSAVVSCSQITPIWLPCGLPTPRRCWEHLDAVWWTRALSVRHCRTTNVSNLIHVLILTRKFDDAVCGGGLHFG